ncbi:uncharacterized protein LAESUDRAFT_666698 [Laetiporus sulphureus 93-53]|uniref:Flavin reductase like domain-containing protein n=1 Tax=Laetiporus sulphureus 93-53 TaxID=1314785 RepID=A0A165B471_9APHY|nr:uncharacterized protein LAESUDRAFT_666698 [Laetiporus sulphureus 93-53]KZT00190.1 hypothetical protein LAESUDRAFT_666698 [Laetiporus sulphureus 93-53]
MASTDDLPPLNHSQEFQLTQSPNPQWHYGQKVADTPEGRAWMEGEKAGWKVVDTAKEDPMKVYSLMNSGIVPRPIAFVSTVSESGVENISPFSWFNMVTQNPPLVFISCTNGPKRVKDTTSNIKSTKGFTVNLISEPWVEAANACSIDAPSGVSEWPLSGLTKEPSIHVKAPRVKESAFSMECELYQAIEIVHPDTGVNTNTMILGLVKYIHVRKDILNERDTVDPAKFKVVGRLSGLAYAHIESAYTLKRPVWAEEEKRIQAALSGSSSGGKLKYCHH